MSKYLSLCGTTYKRKKDAERHTALFTDADELTRNYHVMIKKNFHGRFIDFMINTRPYWKFTGILVIYSTVINHFGIHPTIWESLAIGCGIGLAID